MRPSKRAPDQMREIKITRNYTKHAEGSVLVEFGDTKVICTASVEDRIPRWLKGQGKGWVTAEYGMLPRSTGSRMGREAARGKQGGRTMEIQRLIGRSLRAAVDMKVLGEQQITVDCDVIQADGGTRTASITGGFVALSDAINQLMKKGVVKQNPIVTPIASISVGIQCRDRYECGDEWRWAVHRGAGYRRRGAIQYGRDAADVGTGTTGYY